MGRPPIHQGACRVPHQEAWRTQQLQSGAESLPGTVQEARRRQGSGEEGSWGISREILHVAAVQPAQGFAGRGQQCAFLPLLPIASCLQGGQCDYTSTASGGPNNDGTERDTSQGSQHAVKDS